MFTEAPLDPDDPIFPRNVTRVGNRYQAVVPTWEEQKAIELERAQEPKTADCKSGSISCHVVKLK